MSLSFSSPSSSLSSSSSENEEEEEQGEDEEDEYEDEDEESEEDADWTDHDFESDYEEENSEVNFCEIQATNVYRSKKAIQTNRYNYFFIDEKLKKSKTKHFVLFINNDGTDDTKTYGLDLDINDYLPLNSEIACGHFLNALKQKVSNQTIEISYVTKPRGNVIKAIKNFWICCFLIKNNDLISRKKKYFI